MDTNEITTSTNMPTHIPGTRILANGGGLDDEGVWSLAVHTVGFGLGDELGVKYESTITYEGSVIKLDRIFSRLMRDVVPFSQFTSISWNRVS